MFGLFMLGILGCGCVGAALKNAYHDGNNKQDSIRNNEPYYMDWQGSYRRVDNDHKVCIHTTSMKANWDKVDVDLKTGQILRNYSQEERNKIANREAEFAKENKERKEKALKEGRMWYSSYEITEHGLLLDRYYPYEYVYRRVSDDLLISPKSRHNEVMYDDKHEFILWRNEEAYTRAYMGFPSLETDIRLNWDKIKGEYWQKLHNMTEHELEAYARKIGAIL